MIRMIPGMSALSAAIPKAGLAFIPTIERGMIYATTPTFTFRNHQIYQAVKLDVPEAVTAKLTGGDASLLETKESLQAWDPVMQTERWRVPLVGQFNGGVLSTAGDLVIQGQADGHLVIRRAEDGAVLKDIDVGTSIMAAPMTYQIGADEYVAVMASFADLLSEAEVDAVHAYLPAEQRRAYEATNR